MDAVAPVIAGVIHFMRKPSVSVLVVGGGTGVFSKTLLVPVRGFLKRRGQPVDIKVVETDLEHAAVSKSGGDKAVADVLRLPFKKESFDLVVGQSMIHQGGRNLLGERLAEIKRVISPNGCFVHVQDVPPDFRDWARSNAPPVLNLGTRASSDAFSSALNEAHGNLLDDLRLRSRENGLTFGAAKVRGEAIVSKKHVLGEVGGQNFDRENFFHFHFGAFGAKRAKGISGKKLVYEGFVTLHSLHPRLSEVMRHVENEFVNKKR